MIKIGFCAGHGFNTPGKRSPDDEREWSFNNQVAKAFEKELATYENVITKRFDDPTGKTDVPLKQRTDGANQWGADYYISFHHNAYKGRWGNHTGVETWIYLKASTKSIALAKAIHPAMVKAYGLRNRGIKRGNLHIVRETTMPAILIEGGFMDSTIDIQKLRNNQLLEQVGTSIAQALAQHLRLQRKGGVAMSEYNQLKKEIEQLKKELAKKADLISMKEVSDIHKDAYEWAKNEGLTDGTNPKGPLTREQSFTILQRFYNKYIKEESS